MLSKSRCLRKKRGPKHSLIWAPKQSWPNASNEPQICLINHLSIYRVNPGRNTGLCHLTERRPPEVAHVHLLQWELAFLQAPLLVLPKAFWVFVLGDGEKLPDPFSWGNWVLQSCPLWKRKDDPTVFRNSHPSPQYILLCAFYWLTSHLRHMGHPHGPRVCFAFQRLGTVKLVFWLKFCISFLSSLSLSV